MFAAGTRGVAQRTPHDGSIRPCKTHDFVLRMLIGYVEHRLDGYYAAQMDLK